VLAQQTQQTRHAEDLRPRHEEELERKERQRSRAANSEDFYRERTRQLSSEMLVIVELNTSSHN